MRTKLRSKVTLLFIVCALLIAIPAVAAIADQINTDGDVLNAAGTNDTTVNLGDVNPGQALTPQVSFELRCNGNDHVVAGATVGLNFNSGSSTAGVSATNTSISVPSTWPADGPSTCPSGGLVVGDTANSQVSYTAPKSPGPASFVVTYNVSAPTDGSSSTGIVGGSTRSVTYNMNVRNLPPTINSFLGAPEVTEGQHQLYVINASDPNETTLNYGLSKASGTADVAITPLGTNGHFDVHFQTAGNVVLQASVNDTVNAPVTALKPVTVNPANTAPVVSVTGVNDPSYEIGSEPTPGCSVVDAEDANATADPEIDRSALNSFGLGTVTVTCSYTDTGGLSDSDTMTYTIVDTTDPTASHELSTPANGNGWHKADFTVTLNGSDSGSGVREIRYTIDNGTEQVASGASTTIAIDTEGIKDISYYSVDNAGNDSAVGSVTVRLDKTPPTIDGSASPAPNGAGWNNTDVTVGWNCADALSGVPSCPAAVVLSSNGADQSVARSATDAAGNSASATVGNIDIDKAKPTVSVTGVSNGATYTIGAVPTPGCDTQDQDGLSGVKTNATVNVTGGTLLGVGNFTATCSGAVDNANNNQAAPVSVTYKVTTNWSGFSSPVDNLPTLNSAKAGQAIPLKWRITNSSGNPITNLTSVTVTTSSRDCMTGVSGIDALEEYAAGSSGLQNLGDGYYQFNWKSPTSYANSCKTINLDMGEGVLRQAAFQFKK